jgi:glycosyltransferase involved in cell wall biosynthesis
MMVMTANPAPNVSIVLPVFDRVGSIRAAVESVLRQTYADFELLVVDDGSTDGSMQALLGVSDPRLKLLANPRNMGAGAARNTGIRAARAEWVAFQDSDDEWLPQKLEKQMARLSTTGPECVAVYCGMAVVGEVEQTGPRRTQVRYIPDSTIHDVEGDILSTLLLTSLASTQTLVARRTSLQACGGFDETMPALEDWECAIRLARIGTFAFVDEPLVMQRFSANSITRHRDRRLAAREKIIEKNLDLLSDRPAILAEHYRNIAGEQRRLGLLSEARVALARARSLTPLNPRLWGLSVYLWLKALGLPLNS